MQLILISGLSGSGKSVALHTLEDSGFYCVDNLPATMLNETIRLYSEFGYDRTAISVDTRSSPSLGALPQEMQKLRDQHVDVRLVFLDAQDDTLIKRFSETRRRHPLAHSTLTVKKCIDLERKMLADIQELGTCIDTSSLSPNKLCCWIRNLVAVDINRLTLIFQSFGFKHGIPIDTDFMFDVRCLPNPYYDLKLRSLTGHDQLIVDFFSKEPQVQNMIDDIQKMIAKWLPHFSRENRHSLTIAIGCTGGQHRSVYIAEQLARSFTEPQQVLVRHRQLDER